MTERQVDSDADAKRWGMRGSPTILIDGDDPFGTEADEPSMSCRLYAGGAPTVADLAAALRHATTPPAEQFRPPHSASRDPHRASARRLGELLSY